MGIDDITSQNRPPPAVNHNLDIRTLVQ